MALWRWENIIDNRIVYYRSKTKNKDNVEPQSIALSGKVAEIVAEYTGTPNYIFPIILSNKPRTIKHQLEGALKKINKDLTEIGSIAGIPNPKNITFYTARHTFATVLKKSGHSVEMIKELLGHQDIKTTQIYLGSFDDDAKDDAMKDLL
jgi:integrase